MNNIESERKYPIKTISSNLNPLKNYQPETTASKISSAILLTASAVA